MLAGIKHKIKNYGDEVLKAIFIFTPARPEEPHVLKSVENEVNEHP